MDEPLPRPVSLHYVLLLAVVASGMLPGCAWFKGKPTAQNKPAQIQDKEPAGTAKVAKNDLPAEEAPDANATAAVRSSVKTADPKADRQMAGGPATEDAPGKASVGKAAGNSTGKSADRRTASGRGTGGIVADPTEENAPAGNVKGPGEIVPATASSSGQDPVGTADFQEVKDPVTGLSRIPGDTLTNFPGSIDVIGDGVTVQQGVVACTVNGQPIFVEDVLRDVPAGYIAQYEKQLDPKQFSEWRKQLIEAHLQRPIEEELLLQALQVKLKPEQIKEINKQIDTMFNKEDLPAAMKAQGFQTEVEFEKALKAKGQSIDLLRTKNRNRQLAQQYIQTKVMPKSGFDRPDLLKFYNDHKEDFAIYAQAKWDHIQLDFSKNGGPEATRKKADEIVKRLAAGEDFAAIAKECSNGPNASKGGARGWMRRGTLADEAIDKALFERPLNQVGEPIEDKQGIDIIRVVDRTAAGYKPFSAVQEDIRAQLKNEEWGKASKKLFEELFEKANIVKLTDSL